MKDTIGQPKRKSSQSLGVFYAMVLAAFVLFAACERPELEPEPEVNPIEQVVLVDGPISFSEITTDSIGCGWHNIPYDDQAVLINNTQSFFHYTDCIDGHYPEIDFDSNSVVLWSGWVGGGSYFNTAAIECMEGVVHIDLFFRENLTCVASEPWIKAFLLPKIPGGTSISVEIHVASN